MPLRLELVRLLRDDVHVHRGRVAQETIDGIHVEKFPPAFDGSAAEDTWVTCFSRTNSAVAAATLFAFQLDRLSRRGFPQIACWR